MNETPVDSEFDWIALDEVQLLLGGASRSSVYADPEVRTLAIVAASPDGALAVCVGVGMKLSRWCASGSRAVTPKPPR